MKLTSMIMKVMCPALISVVSASKDTAYQITKEFNFKDDFYLKVCPLGNAIGPDNVGLFMSALEDYSTRFRDEWEYQVREDLHNGTCSVDVSNLMFYIVCYIL